MTTTIFNNDLLDDLDFGPVPFDSTPEEDASAAALRSKGQIRVSGIIDIALNDRLKALARKQGRTADQLIGELITRSAGEVDRLEAQQEVERLKERFGDSWLERLQEARNAIQS